MSWLRRSGQSWKVTTTQTGALLGLPTLLTGIAEIRKSPFPLLIGVVLVLAAAGLPLSVLCRVCGLHIWESSWARPIPRRHRLTWVASVERCPQCGHDGIASGASRQRWRDAGAPAERRYWSTGRVSRVLLIALMLAAGIFVAQAYYRLR